MDTNVIKIINIPESVATYIQRLTYEMEGLRNILSSIMINKHKLRYTTEHYHNFMKEYRKAYSEYQLALEEIRQIYCKELVNETNFNITVHFYDCIIIVTRKDD